MAAKIDATVSQEMMDANSTSGRFTITRENGEKAVRVSGVSLKLRNGEPGYSLKSLTILMNISENEILIEAARSLVIAWQAQVRKNLDITGLKELAGKELFEAASKIRQRQERRELTPAERKYQENLRKATPEQRKAIAKILGVELDKE